MDAKKDHVWRVSFDLDTPPVGPFTIEGLMEMAKNGALQPEHLISMGGQWKPAGEMPGLFKHSALATVVEPPPARPSPQPPPIPTRARELQQAAEKARRHVPIAAPWLLGPMALGIWAFCKEDYFAGFFLGYPSLAIAAASAAVISSRFLPALRQYKRPAIIAAIATIWIVWGWNDTWLLPDWPLNGPQDVRFFDTYTRWGRVHVHRRAVFNDGNSAEGPMSPSGKPHGHWKFHKAFFQRDDVWYWYGDQVSEGHWHELAGK